MRTINWGIIGTGKISKTFATALVNCENNKFIGSFSRNADNVKIFNEMFKAEKTFNSLDELLSDSDIDVVYIGVPHNGHFELAKKTLLAGKNVICEKPICINSKELNELVKVARDKNLFLMEALWTRFLPAILEAKKILDSGIIGKLKFIYADFSFSMPYDEVSKKGRVFNPDLAGGALLDVGIYPLNFGAIFGGEGKLIDATATFTHDNVDSTNAMMLRYPNDVIGMLTSGVTALGSNNGRLVGEVGEIILPNFWKGEEIIIKQRDKEDVVLKFPHRVNGYEYELTATEKAIRNGEVEIQNMKLEDSMHIMDLLDQVRAKIGLKYPTIED